MPPKTTTAAAAAPGSKAQSRRPGASSTTTTGGGGGGNKANAAALAAAGRSTNAAGRGGAAGSRRLSLGGGAAIVQSDGSSSSSRSSSASARGNKNSSVSARNNQQQRPAADPFLAFTAGLAHNDSVVVDAHQQHQQQQLVDPATHPFQSPGGPGGISQSAVMYAMLEDQTELFRIVDGTRLLFYNDTSDVDFVVKIRFDEPGKFNPHGSARWFAEMLPAEAAAVTASEFLERVASGGNLRGSADRASGGGGGAFDLDSLDGGGSDLRSVGSGSMSAAATLMSPVGSMVFRSPSLLRHAFADKEGEDAAAAAAQYVVSRYVMDIVPPGETNLFGSGAAIGSGYVISFGQRPHVRADRTAEPLSCEHIFDHEHFTDAQNRGGVVSKTAKVYPIFPDGLRFFRVHDAETLLFYNDTEDTQFVVRIDVDAAVAAAGGAPAGFDARASVRLLGSATRETVKMHDNNNNGGSGSGGSGENSNTSNNGGAVSRYVITDIVSPGAVQPVLAADMHLSHFSLSVQELRGGGDSALGEAVADDFVFRRSAGWDRGLVSSKFVAVFAVLPGKLYRIHDGERLLFYNDTEDENLDVVCEFPALAHVSPFGSAIRKKLSSKRAAISTHSKGVTITDVVYAGRTQMFCKGDTARHTITVVSRPVPKPAAADDDDDVGDGAASKSQTPSADNSARRGATAETDASATAAASASSTKKKASAASKYTAGQVAAGAGSTRKASALLVDPVTFDFLGPGPMHLTDTARVYSMFEDVSRLFRIVNMNFLFFYNDTATHDFIVRVTFPQGCGVPYATSSGNSGGNAPVIKRVVPAGTANVDAALSNAVGNGAIVIVDVVPPNATKCVAENVPGHSSGYRVSFAMVPARSGAAAAGQASGAGATGGARRPLGAAGAAASGIGGSAAGRGAQSGGGGAASAASAAPAAGIHPTRHFVVDSSDKRGVGQRALLRPTYSLNGPAGVKSDHLVFECFDAGDGMCYRVVAYPGLNRWWFYNDTIDAEMHVAVKFYGATGLRALGTATVVHSSDGKEDVDLVSDVILPGQTSPFISAQGDLQHFSCNFSAKSVSAANKRRMREAAAPLVAEERERFKQMLHDAEASGNAGGGHRQRQNQKSGGGNKNSNGGGGDDAGDAPFPGSTVTQEEAIDLCVDELVAFIDQQFPPHDYSIFRPTRDPDDPGFVAWIRPAAAAAAGTAAVREKLVAAADAAGGGDKDQQDAALLGSAAVFKGQKSSVFDPIVGGSGGRGGAKGGGGDEDDEDDVLDALNAEAAAAAAARSSPTSPTVHQLESANHMELIAPHLVRDGSILNTWLSCAIAALAAQPEFIRDVFRCLAPRDPGRRRIEQSLGVHRISILRNEWFCSEIIDDFLPCVGRSLCGIRHATHPTTELWPALLEKAFAKLHGSYGAIVGGDPLLALSTVTGFACSRLDREFRHATHGVDGSGSGSGTASALLFSTLRDACEAGNICIAATKSSNTMSDAQIAVEEHKLRESGLELDRAYHIVDMKLFHIDSNNNSTGAGGAADDSNDKNARKSSANVKSGRAGAGGADLRLVRVRNNWLDAERHSGWAGAWSDKDAVNWRAHPDIAKACGVVPPLSSLDTPTTTPRSLAAAARRASLMHDEEALQRRKQHEQQEEERRRLRAQQQQQLQQQQDGSLSAAAPYDFWIEWKDLLRFCSSGGICYAHRKWTNFRVRTHFQPQDGTCQLALRVTCKAPTSAIFCIAQPGLPREATEARFGRPFLSVSLALLAPHEDHISEFLGSIRAADDSAADAAAAAAAGGPSKNAAAVVAPAAKKYAIRASSSRVISNPSFASATTQPQHVAGRYIGLKYDFAPTKNNNDTPSSAGGGGSHTPLYVVPHCDLIMEGEDAKTLAFCFCAYVEDAANLTVEFVKIEKVARWFGAEDDDDDADGAARGEGENDDDGGNDAGEKPGAAAAHAVAKPREVAWPVSCSPVDEDYQIKVLGQTPKQKHGWQFE